MRYLIFASLLWSLSFGLIKQYLIGVDSTLVAGIRLFFSFLIFLPFMKSKNMKTKMIIRLMVIGFFQYGVMYILYIESYQYLKAYEVALFTIFTPLFVVIVDNIIRKNSNQFNYIKALLSIIGAMIISYTQADYRFFFIGFALLQCANLCFAFGQVYYKRVMADIDVKDKDIYSWIYLGALILPVLMSLNSLVGDATSLNESQWYTLIYLGIVPSGLGFFFWNKGATLVKIDVLAVFNNLKIPIALIVTILIFQEKEVTLNLLIGTIIIIVAAMDKKDFTKVASRFLQKR